MIDAARAVCLPARRQQDRRVRDRPRKWPAITTGRGAACGWAIGHGAQPRPAEGLRRDISTYGIDQRTGSLTLQGSATTKHAPTFLAPDRTGKYLLSAYYQGGSVAVHPIEADGTIGTQPIDQHETAVGAHAISTDPSNRFAFVPHIARIQDNALEPPRDNPGPNVILQFRFDAETGRLSPNSSFRVEPSERLGPRHY